MYIKTSLFTETPFRKLAFRFNEKIKPKALKIKRKARRDTSVKLGEIR